MRYAPNVALCKPKLLLGEGVDEWMFFTAMLTFLGITDVQVDQYAGKSKLDVALKVFTKRPGFSATVTSLAIIRDADYLDGQPAMACRSAFSSVQTALKEAGLAVPHAIGAPAGAAPTVSVFVMPNCASDGMLEDLCVTATTPQERNCIDAYLNCVQVHTGRAQQTHTLAKARTHAWLASQIPPDLKLGEAAASGFVDWNHPAFASLIQFVRSL